MSYRFATANLGPKDSTRVAVVRRLLAREGLDVIGTNETSPAAKREIARHLEWDSWVPRRHNGFAWRRSAVVGTRVSRRRIMRGGKRRVGKVRRRRRLGPSRFAIALRVRDGDRAALHVQTHLMARAWTRHPWRRPLWWASVAALRTYIAWLSRRPANRGLPIIVSGDVNTDIRRGRINLGRGFVELDTPDTFGRSRYDRVFYRGPVSVQLARTIRTGSDHRALVLNVELR